jgi:hypothetical protein
MRHTVQEMTHGRQSSATTDSGGNLLIIANSSTIGCVLFLFKYFSSNVFGIAFTCGLHQV